MTTHKTILITAVLTLLLPLNALASLTLVSTDQQDLTFQLIKDGETIFSRTGTTGNNNSLIEVLRIEDGEITFMSDIAQDYTMETTDNSITTAAISKKYGYFAEEYQHWYFFDQQLTFQVSPYEDYDLAYLTLDTGFLTLNGELLSPDENNLYSQVD